MTKLRALFSGLVLLSSVGLCIPTSASTHLSHMLSPTVYVAGHMNVERFQQLINTHHFKSVIVNRPDEEIGNLVTVSRLRPIAEQAKISLVYQPVKSGTVSQADVIEFAQYYNTLSKPILMICKTGTRSRLLYEHAKAKGMLHE